jgi:2-oxoglutarate dehydrogenase E2 component (dihydrolipoamide succinyltransferase)
MGEHGPARWQGTGTGKRSVRATTSSAPAEEPAAPVEQGEPKATDAARALAAEYNINLAAITGTGADGQITKDDVSVHVPAPPPEPEPEPVESAPVETS